VKAAAGLARVHIAFTHAAVGTIGSKKDGETFVYFQASAAPPVSFKHCFSVNRTRHPEGGGFMAEAVPDSMLLERMEDFFSRGSVTDAVRGTIAAAVVHSTRVCARSCHGRTRVRTCADSNLDDDTRQIVCDGRAG
jgi:hypothetical protein